MQDELVDRFGDIPKSVENLLVIARVRALAHKCYVAIAKAVGTDRNTVRKYYDEIRSELGLK